ncbi:MAG: ATP-binding protein [Clostridiales bacterium]|nr:ATP-binding protein [Clostridiales bacterium]
MHPELTKYYARVQKENRQKQQQRFDECAQKHPRLKQIAAAKLTLLLDVAKRRFTSDEGKRRLTQLQHEQDMILLQNGLPKDFLDPIYSCPYCGDTGYVGDPIRQPCSCHLLLLQQYLADGAQINATETFEAFDESVYPTEPQRKNALATKKVCEAWADALPPSPRGDVGAADRGDRPNPSPAHLLLLGQPGLGKSYLGNAIAHRAVSGGTTALRTTAYRFISDIMEGISERKERLFRYTQPQLLVLDDLGIEPLIPSITVESIFHVLNERLLGRRPTVIITNLDYAELSERYGERVSTRLYDTNSFGIYRLSGENLRLVKN